ncbi:MAG: glycoside hydrolase family 1 protein [bacterium]
MRAFTFPSGFRWGTATSAHQVEGNNEHNDWWAWEHEPGRIRNGDRSGRACAWWENAEYDFDLAVRLHQNAHRLSVEWSRIEPVPGQWDQSALDRYRQMLRALRERGIEPMVTLHHFTNPLWFAARGGWEQDDAVALFGRYVGQVCSALGEFTSLWCTINEPMGWVFSAYLSGRFPPGHHRAVFRAVRAATQLARAHAAAYNVLHGLQPHAQVGVANYFRLFDPAVPALPLDRFVAAQQDHFVNRAFLEAVTSGHVRAFPWIADIPEAAGTLDFLGVNYYTRDMVSFDLTRPGSLFGRNFLRPGAPQSDSGYGEIYAEGMYRVLRLAQRYGKPIFITENGLPDADDDLRAEFILAHLGETARAIRDGVDVRGYYHWSLIDNFEWADGWSMRFGLIALDLATQVRTLRPSARVYADICRANALT